MKNELNRKTKFVEIEFLDVDHFQSIKCFEVVKGAKHFQSSRKSYVGFLTFQLISDQISEFLEVIFLWKKKWRNTSDVPTQESDTKGSIREPLPSGVFILRST